MKITVDAERIVLLKEIADLQKLKAQEIKELDIIKNEIADQRAGKNQV